MAAAGSLAAATSLRAHGLVGASSLAAWSRVWTADHTRIGLALGLSRERDLEPTEG